MLKTMPNIALFDSLWKSDLSTNCWSFAYDRTSEIHSMAIHCVAAEHYGLLKKKEKKVNGLKLKAFPTYVRRPNNASCVCLNCGIDSLAETVSDQCMGELVGVGVKPVKCSISTECIRVMTQQGRTGYHLTHQLLYGMVAEQVTVRCHFFLHCQVNSLIARNLYLSEINCLTHRSKDLNFLYRENVGSEAMKITAGLTDQHSNVCCLTFVQHLWRLLFQDCNGWTTLWNSLLSKLWQCDSLGEFKRLLKTRPFGNHGTSWHFSWECHLVIILLT